MVRRTLAALLLLAFGAVAHAQNAIPTPDEYLGYQLGTQFTPHHRIVEYFNELARRSPLITVEKFGETAEGRPLVFATITSEKNRAALEQIRTDVAALAGAQQLDSARAAEIAKRSPAIVWLAYGVHGNESSSAEAAMRVASTLLRSESSALLDQLVVIIDPLQNPDGRERYIQWFRRTGGAAPNANADALEHWEPWPGGRYNHYMVDMNRDWAWSSQRETQARLALFHRWNPQVFVDLHEMGYQSSYFFPPDAKPVNTNIHPEVEKWLDTFGRANADVFSKRGWQFFVGETFDLFYPGYGDSWPSLHGAIGMTYEVAGHSHGGLAVDRDDGTTLTLADRIERHFTSSMTTVRTAAANREGLLLYTWNAMRAWPQQGKSSFLIAADAPNTPALVHMLQRQGIEFGQLRSPVTVKGTRVGADAAESHAFPAGTLVVSTRQRFGGLVQTLLEKSPTVAPEFLEEQRTKVEADEPDQFYDLTTWSLPLAMNVETWTVTSTNLDTVPYQEAAATPFRNAGYAWIVSGNDPNVYRFAGRLLANDIRFSVASDAVEVGPVKYARGSIVVMKGNNKQDVDASLQKIAAATGVNVIGLESGWSGGTSLGSERIQGIKKPRIALLGGAGTAATSFGELWHTLDVDTPIPHTVVGVDTLKNVDLRRYDVIVMPDGSYDDRIGKKGTERLQAWLREGGTLVAIGGASSFLRDKDVDISKLKPWEAPKKKDDDPPATDQRYNEFRIPGAAFRTSMNERSFLTFGMPKAPSVLIEGTTAYRPVAHKVDNIVTIAEKDPLVSGVAWPESLERIQGSVYTVSEPYGKGQVITFADAPHFRLFWRGTLPLFLNAVLYSPSFPR